MVHPAVQNDMSVDIQVMATFPIQVILTQIAELARSIDFGSQVGRLLALGWAGGAQIDRGFFPTFYQAQDVFYPLTVIEIP
jgi:hypothetical protein